MTAWKPLPQDDELARADELLGQADALLRRYRGHDEAAPPAAAFDDAELPILTDVVDEAELPALGLPASATPTPATPTPAPPTADAPPPAPPAAATALSTPAAAPSALPGAAPAPALAPGAAPAPPATAVGADALDAQLVNARAALADELVELDTEITRKVEAWLEAELPQIVARELDQFTERLHAEVLARLRATLLPSLSERIGSHIDKLVD